MATKKEDQQEEPKGPENLNKENFWNELNELYPDAMLLFCTWIDKYKLDNKWNFLFNVGRGYHTKSGEHAVAPKFHDLPLAMQLGIWIQFKTELKGDKDTWEIDDVFDYNFRIDIEEWMEERQKLIEKKK